VTNRIVYDRDQILTFLGASSLFRFARRIFPGSIVRLIDRHIVGKIWSAKIIAQKTGRGENDN
jgi:hypothetical protein